MTRATPRLPKPPVRRHGFGRFGLGRLASVDLRDHLHLAQPRRAPAMVHARYWFAGAPLDQGSTSQCVAYASNKFLTAGPVRNMKDVPTPQTIYDAARARDEWPGEDYEGTSVRGAFKFLAEIGYIQEYQWAYDVETCANWILTVGPMVFGTIWTETMFDPDRGGFLSVTGAVAGGHSYLVRGCNRDKRCPDGSKGAFRILNSWDGWGQSGQAWLPFVEATKLLREDGEAVCAREIRKVVIGKAAA